MQTLNEIFHNFLGTWSLSRSVVPHGSLEGRASFFRIDDITLQYEERGELSLNEGETLSDVSKKYLYKLEEDAIAVYFDDGPDKGKLFHR